MLVRLGSPVNGHITTKVKPHFHIKGKKFQGNSFLVPRWGGFYIHNVNTTSDTIPIKHEIDLGPVLTEILPQLKSLLGFSQTAVSIVCKGIITMLR